MHPGDSQPRLGYRCAMNLVRAAYSVWYFTIGSHWQPEGRV
jgi:hypothetical protein